MKYVMFLIQGQRIPVVQPEVLDHGQFYYGLQQNCPGTEVVSAGFCSFGIEDATIQLSCWGHSQSLHVKSQPQDHVELRALLDPLPYIIFETPDGSRHPVFVPPHQQQRLVDALKVQYPGFKPIAAGFCKLHPTEEYTIAFENYGEAIGLKATPDECWDLNRCFNPR